MVLKRGDSTYLNSTITFDSLARQELSWLCGKRKICLSRGSWERQIFRIGNPSGLRPACWRLDDIRPNPVISTVCPFSSFPFFFYLVLILIFLGGLGGPDGQISWQLFRCLHIRKEGHLTI
jgi:hypothetical protein